MSEQVFSDVWYASQTYLNEFGSVRPGAVYEDRGFLAVVGQSLELRGLDGITPFPEVQTIALEQRPLAFFTKLSLFFAGGMFALCGLCGGIGFPLTLFLDPLAAEIGMLVIFLFLVGGISMVVGLFFVWLGWKATPWVKVTYQGGKIAYFADGRMFGWRGIAGGTKQLEGRLRVILF